MIKILIIGLMGLPQSVLAGGGEEFQASTQEFVRIVQTMKELALHMRSRVRATTHVIQDAAMARHFHGDVQQMVALSRAMMQGVHELVEEVSQLDSIPEIVRVPQDAQSIVDLLALADDASNITVHLSAMASRSAYRVIEVFNYAQRAFAEEVTQEVPVASCFGRWRKWSRDWMTRCSVLYQRQREEALPEVDITMNLFVQIATSAQAIAELAREAVRLSEVSVQIGDRSVQRIEVYGESQIVCEMKSILERIRERTVLTAIREATARQIAMECFNRVAQDAS